jgi:hypothetical protein
MPRTLVSCMIGFFSFLAWFLGGALFEVPGKNSVEEIVAGCIALILYLVLGQCLLPRDPTTDTAEDWRVRACMAVPLLALALLILGAERHDTFLPLASLLAGGCIGVLLGGLLARSLTRSAHAGAAHDADISKLLGNCGATLYIGVSVILVALVMPEVEYEMSLHDTDRAASRGIIVLAVLHAVFAAAVLWTTRKGKAPVVPAASGFLMSLMLAGVGTAYTSRGPAMRLASIALFVCAAIDVLVCVCCAGMAIQHTDVPPFLERH